MTLSAKRYAAVLAIAMLMWSASGRTAADDSASVVAAAAQPSLSKERIRELLIPQGNSQNGGFFKRSVEGWWWYKDPAEEEEDLEQGQPQDIVKYLDSAKTVEETREIFQASLNTALMKPTRFNVKRYMYAKEWFMDRAEVFSNVVQRVRWQSPDLDYSVNHPVNSKGLSVYKELRRQEDEQNMVAVAEQGDGIFFFMSSDCQYCAALAPIVRDIQLEFGVPVMAISLDGGGLPEFPTPRHDNGISEQLGVYTVPTLFLVRPSTEEYIPIGSGMMSKGELIERIYALTQRTIGQAR